jgi:hypothetical protein
MMNLKEAREVLATAEDESKEWPTDEALTSALRAAMAEVDRLTAEREAEDKLVKDGWCWQYIDYDDWSPRYCWIKARATVQEVSNPDRMAAARLALEKMNG